MNLPAILTVSGFTLAAWLVHAGLVQLYLHRFPYTSWQFSLVHGLELLIAPSIAFWIYFKYVNQLSPLAVVAVMLLTIAVIDVIVFSQFFPDGRKLLTFWNLVAPMAVLSGIVYLLGSKPAA